jgi:hypothetical protein
MIRQTVLVVTAGILMAIPATATAEAARPAIAVGAQDVAFNTGSSAADAVINGLIAAIFGPNDPSKCIFPYCF